MSETFEDFLHDLDVGLVIVGEDYDVVEVGVAAWDPEEDFMKKLHKRHGTIF